MQGDPKAKYVPDPSEGVDKSALRELMLVAKARADEQQVWNALTVKVPEYAPWAPHAFARMQEQYAKCQSLVEADADKYSQEEVDKAASALNAIINSMRPGNLPELEDMAELNALMEKARLLQQSHDSEQLSRALGYAGMVVRYVSDGSGTRDMIDRAVSQLKEFVK